MREALKSGGGIVLLCCSLSSMADWTVTEGPGGGQQILIATTQADGYTLEIYKDSVAAIRSRFTLPAGLLSFPRRSCPTFQIDQGAAHNLSVDNASCLAGEQWAEYILGYVSDNRIESSTLPGLLYGAEIRYRFRLTNGDYREIGFSLQGSKRALHQVIGEQVVIAQQSGDAVAQQ